MKELTCVCFYLVASIVFCWVNNHPAQQQTLSTVIFCSYLYWLNRVTLYRPVEMEIYRIKLLGLIFSCFCNGRIYALMEIEMNYLMIHVWFTLSKISSQFKTNRRMVLFDMHLRQLAEILPQYSFFRASEVRYETFFQLFVVYECYTSPFNEMLKKCIVLDIF